jgi:hypothetical protein
MTDERDNPGIKLPPPLIYVVVVEVGTGIA